MKRILIIYATQQGSTKEVAEAIEKTLATTGFEAVCKNVNENPDVNGFDGYVIGSPVHGMQLMPEASTFIERHASLLKGKAVYYFLLGIATQSKRGFIQKGYEKIFERTGKILPYTGKALFGGVIDKDPPFILRLIFGLEKNTPKDTRDFQAITSWASTLF